MTLDQIEVLNMIVQTGSFRKASEKLNRAQSAISYAVTKLEDEIGFKLFTRDGWRALLTDKGRLFYQRSLQLSLKSNELIRFCETIRSQQGHVNISYSLTIPHHWLNQLISMIRQSFPDSDLRLFHNRSEDHLNTMRSGHAHIALSDQPDNDPEVISKPLSEFILEPVISNKVHDVDEPELKKMPGQYHQIVVDPHPSFGDGRRRMRSGSTSVISVNSMDQKKQLIDEGAGWGYLPFTTDAHPGNYTRINGLPVYHKTIYAQMMISCLNASSGLRKLWNHLEPISF